jgi:hypothetical protein
MNNENKNADKSIPTSVKRDRRWTLLFIGDRGKTITFSSFKGVVLSTICVLLISAAVAGGFYHLYQVEKNNNAGLQNDMDNLRQVVTSLRNEKDILMARLVVAESRVKEKLEKEDKPQPEQRAADFVGIDRQAAKISTGSQPETQLKVAVEDFIVFHEPDINTLRVQYKVINTGSKEQPGFKVNDQPGPDQFNTATVFVFSLTGDLLLEKDFAVGIKSQTISTQ